MKTLFSFVLVSCFAIIGSAQERVIDKAEFDAITTRGWTHHLIWKGEKYRMTVTTSSKVPGRPQTDWSSKMIFEYGPEKEHRMFATSAFAQKPAQSRESLILGKWIYSRSGNGAWTRKLYEPADDLQAKDEAPLDVVSTIAEYKYLGTSGIMGKPAHVYIKTERRTNKNNSESDIKVTYWIGVDGALLKNEFSSENRSHNLTSRTFVTTEWEIDPSVTFREPEIAPDSR